LVTDIGAAGSGQPLEGGESGLRVQLAAVGHIKHLLVEPDAPPQLGCFIGAERFSPDACLRESGLHER
jgi:hypothetical protein